jgi:hypothetical protein
MAPATKPRAKAAMKLPTFIALSYPQAPGPSWQWVLPAKWAYPFTLRRSFLDRINAEWVIASRRLSPRLLIAQLSVAADRIAEFWSAADLDALGDGVSWAGATPAPAWLDAARDFSEYWTHQPGPPGSLPRPDPAP